MAARTEQEQVRFSKLKALREAGFAFPNDVKLTANCRTVSELQPLPVEEAPIHTVAGRLVQMRIMGKASFAHILDESGKLQIYVTRDDLGVEAYQEFKKLDLGDIVETSGYVFVTKTGEKTLHVKTLRLLTKSLIPLPEKWHGLTDVESRYRYRYVDLIANPEVREIFKKRARIIREIRSFLDNRGFVEVETPVLTYVAGGAAARPFETFYNALDCNMYVRIALELPLKKLVVGGLERVYEIGRVFRNEGLSKKHNPEFTMIEFYQAYATYQDLMDLTEQLICDLALKVRGSLKFQYCGRELDLTPPWPRISMLESIYQIGGLERTIDIRTLEGARDAATKRGVELSDPQDWGKCLDNLWEELVEDKLFNPVFIIHHPFSISPLARRNQEDPNITDRFELIMGCMEVANAFSELNDAEDQRSRFEAQARRRAAGDHEANAIDEDFLRALEYGMPPTAGEGIGIDRIVMLLTDSATIRDVLLFPQLKPLEVEQAEDSEGSEVEAFGGAKD
ncbi:MAG: lysine--tRNA ligase [Deltaproteobacteria bacterium]|nr:lysine--tRNA ligase [Deltaproteobacteria bacterium]